MRKTNLDDVWVRKGTTHKDIIMIYIRRIIINIEDKQRLIRGSMVEVVYEGFP
jgi:hypothetical protein